MSTKDSLPSPASLVEISHSLKELKSVAEDLNAASDLIGRSIGIVDDTLKSLNLGVSAWIKFADNEDIQSGSYWERSVGYDRFGSKWGVAIRTEEGSTFAPEDAHNESWLFNDAPRTLRLEAIEKIPELVQELIKVARALTTDIEAKAEHARRIAGAFNQSSNASSPRK